MSADPTMRRPGASAGTSAPDARHRLEALYVQNLSPLRAYLGGVLRSDCDADDVAQEAFLRLLRCPDLDEYKNLRAVLFKTAHRLALNVIRRRRSSPIDRAEINFDLESAPLAQAPTAEQSLIESEQEAAYTAALTRLSPRCRQVIELRTETELSYKEISSTLGVSVSTLEKHLNRGKRVCAELLADWRVVAA